MTAKTKRQRDFDNTMLELQELIEYYKEHKCKMDSSEKRSLIWDIYGVSGDMYNKMRRKDYVDGK